MTKEEFKQKMADANERMRLAKRDILALRRKYIEENAPYKVGDKVRIDTPAHDKCRETTEYGYITNISVTDEGMFRPDLHACKKDGSERKNKNLWVIYSLNPTFTVVKE